ncbi:hypothetical protein MATL_G00235530 [Megalops atlanticus]|uniref:Ig-like domain-containing protein n=1 Tax=Megalops atlanticus TaxID=7932 RepID=A0A9D3PG02_MEGAT|nr:hypothetical protein MATL_G00235530 [Megalops atlanticus]
MEPVGRAAFLLSYAVIFLLIGTDSTLVRAPRVLHGVYGQPLLLPVEHLFRVEDMAEVQGYWLFRRRAHDFTQLVTFMNNKSIVEMEAKMNNRFSFHPPNASLLINRLDESMEGDYKLVISVIFPSRAGMVKDNDNLVHVTVDVPVSTPVIEMSPASEVVEDRDSVMLRCSAENGTRVVYEWYRNGSPSRAGGRLSNSSAPDGSVLTISPVRKEDIGDYTCAAKNNVSLKTSLPVPLSVFYGPYNLAVSSDQGLRTGAVFTVNPGELVFFDCSADSNPPNSCAWISETNNDTEVITTGRRSEVVAYKLAHTEEYVCRAFNNITQKQDETRFTLVVASWGAGKEKHFQEGSFVSPLAAIAVSSLLIIGCMLLVMLRKTCHPHRVIMKIYNRPLTEQKGPHLSGHEDATEDFGIYEFVSIPGKAESTQASSKSLVRLDSVQDLHTTIYDVIRHIPETPTQSLLK